VPEQLGDYFYFLKTREFPAALQTKNGTGQYQVYVRQRANLLKTNQLEADRKEEVVLDQLEVPFIPN